MSRGTISRDDPKPLEKKSMIQIQNTDHNCFWYSVAILKSVFCNHPMTKHIKEGSRARYTIAFEFCKSCGFTWTEPVSIDMVSRVEELLDCNLTVIELNGIPLLGGNLF